MTERTKLAVRQQNAAKCRRERENMVLVELSRLLPIPFSVAVRLDKATVVRLSCAYLKLRELFPYGIGREWGGRSQPDGILELGAFLNTALEGFVFVLGDDAKILYVSEGASTQLGLSQVPLLGPNFACYDLPAKSSVKFPEWVVWTSGHSILELIGNSLYDFIHENDVSEVKNLMCHEQSIPALYASDGFHEDIEVPRSFEIRMKCTLPKRQAELAVDGYKVIHCKGYLKLRQNTAGESVVSDPSIRWYRVVGIVAAGHSLPSAPIAEIKIHKKDFMFKTGLDLKFMHLEPRIAEITGYEPSYLMNKSLYTFIHPYDGAKLQDVHLRVLRRNQAITRYYRFLTRGGGWIWIQSSYLIISNNKANSQHNILVINHVLSGRESEEMILDLEQLCLLRAKPLKLHDSSTKRSQKGRKKAQSKSSNLNLTNNLQQMNQSLLSTAMPVSELLPSQEIPSEAFGFLKYNLDSNMLDSDKMTRDDNDISRFSSIYATSNSNNSFSFDNPGGKCNNIPCWEFINNVNGYSNLCSPFTRNCLTNVKFNIPCGGSSMSTSTAYTNMYVDNQEATSGLSPYMHNSNCELEQLSNHESIKTDYLNDCVGIKNSENTFSPLSKKSKSVELLTNDFSAEPTKTQCLSDPIDIKKATNSWNPLLIKEIRTNEQPVSFINIDQNSLLENAVILESGNGELLPQSMFYSNETNSEMSDYTNNNKSYQFDSTLWNHSQNINTLELDHKHVDNSCVSPDFNSATAEKQTLDEIDDDKFLYSSDVLQMYFPSIPERRAYNVSPANKNVDTTQDFKNDSKNGVLSDTKQASIAIATSNQSPTVNRHCFNLRDFNRGPQEQLRHSGPEIASNISSNLTADTSTFGPSVPPLSPYNELITLSSIHKNTNTFPVFGDVVNLINNADIFPNEAYSHLGFNADNDNNNSLQLCPNKSSSNKIFSKLKQPS